MAGGHQRGGLLDDAALEASAVVANCAMNRERQLAGVNSYARELRFGPLDVLTAVIAGRSDDNAGTGAWLDLCCGTGRALIQAASQLHQAGLSDLSRHPQAQAQIPGAAPTIFRSGPVSAAPLSRAGSAQSRHATPAAAIAGLSQPSRPSPTLEADEPGHGSPDPAGQ